MLKSLTSKTLSDLLPGERAATVALICAASPNLPALAIAANTAAALRRAAAMTMRFGIVPVRKLTAQQQKNLALCGHTRRAISGAEQVRRNALEWKRRGW